MQLEEIKYRQNPQFELGKQSIKQKLSSKYRLPRQNNNAINVFLVMINLKPLSGGYREIRVLLRYLLLDREKKRLKQ